MSARKDIEALRAEIDGIDERIVELLEERVKLVRAIATYKAAAGLPLVDPAREAAIVARAAERSTLSEEALREAFEGIFACCRKAI